MSKLSVAEERFALAWALNVTGLAAPLREHRFHDEREWRFDFAWPACKVALEIEGRGRHQTVKGARDDCEKYNEAARLGWKVIRFPATDVGEVLQWVEYLVEVISYG